MKRTFRFAGIAPLAVVAVMLLGTGVAGASYVPRTSLANDECEERTWRYIGGIWWCLQNSNWCTEPGEHCCTWCPE
jgi:hypothetical protein